MLQARSSASSACREGLRTNQPLPIAKLASQASSSQATGKPSAAFALQEPFPTSLPPVFVGHAVKANIKTLLERKTASNATAGDSPQVRKVPVVCHAQLAARVMQLAWEVKVVVSVLQAVSKTL